MSKYQIIYKDNKLFVDIFGKCNNRTKKKLNKQIDDIKEKYGNMDVIFNSFENQKRFF